MDISLQIQGIKTFIDNMKLQVENIEIQNNNAMNPLMMNQIGDQLLNLSIQMLNNGIQYFNNFKHLSMNINQYYEKLNVISQQIILTSQQITNQMMQIQMPLQQQIIQPQMMEPIQMQQNNDKEKYNVSFKDGKGKKTNLIVDEDMTIKELIDKYMNRVYGYENKKLIFIYDANQINRNSQTKLKKFFGLHLYLNPQITVFISEDLKAGN